MRFEGKVKKSGKFWLVSIPALSAMTQGRTIEEAYDMAGSWVKDILCRQDLVVDVYPGKGGKFELACDDDAAMVALLLQRQRQARHVSLAEAAKAMKQTSRTAYARYERGKTVPTIGKLRQLLRSVGAGDVVIRLAE